MIEDIEGLVDLSLAGISGRELGSWGWTLPQDGWEIDKSGKGVYPSAQNSLKISRPGSAYSDFAKIKPGRQYVFEYMVDIEEIKSGQIKVKLHEYNIDTSDAALINTIDYGTYESKTVDYVTESYTPTNPNVNAVVIEIHAEGENSHLLAYLDGICLSEVMDCSELKLLQQPHVVLRFDDGWRSQFMAIQIMESLHYPGVFNIIPEAVVEASDTHNTMSLKYLDKSEILNLIHMGHQVGAHSANDDIVNASSSEKFSATVGSANRLRGLGIETTAYASPKFLYDNETLGYIYRNYYAHEIGETRNIEESKFPFNRYKLYTNIEPTAYNRTREDASDQANILIDEAIAKNATVTLLFHKIVNPSDGIVSSPTEETVTTFADIIIHLKDNEKKVTPVTYDQLLAWQKKTLKPVGFNSDFNLPFLSQPQRLIPYSNLIELPRGTDLAFSPEIDQNILPGIGDIQPDNARTLYGLPEPLIKTPVRLPVSTSAFSQDIYVSYPHADLGLGTIPGGLTGTRAYIVGENARIYRTSDMGTDASLPLLYSGEDTFTDETVYKIALNINEPGKYYIVLKTPNGTLLKSHSFNVVADPFSDIGAVMVKSYSNTNTRNFREISRTVKIVDSNKTLVRVIPDMPDTMLPEGNVFATTGYLATMYNTWDLFLEKGSPFSINEKENMQRLLMDQAPWMLAMQVPDANLPVQYTRMKATPTGLWA